MELKGRAVKQVGHAILRITLPDGKIESYLLTLPKLRIEGLIFGSPYVEYVAETLLESD